MLFLMQYTSTEFMYSFIAHYLLSQYLSQDNLNLGEGLVLLGMTMEILAHKCQKDVLIHPLR